MVLAEVKAGLKKHAKLLIAGGAIVAVLGFVFAPDGGGDSVWDYLDTATQYQFKGTAGSNLNAEIAKAFGMQGTAVGDGSFSSPNTAIFYIGLAILIVGVVAHSS